MKLTNKQKIIKIIKSCVTEEQLINLRNWLEEVTKRQSLYDLGLKLTDYAFIGGLIAGKIVGLRK